MLHGNSLQITNYTIFLRFTCMRSKFHILFSVAVPARYDGVYGDIFTDGFTPPSSSIAPMFPFYENSSEWDDFGEVINPDDYVIKEEGMDQGSLQVVAHLILIQFPLLLIPKWMPLFCYLYFYFILFLVNLTAKEI